MNRNDFLAMINKTSFDSLTKELLMTSYDTGFRYGKIKIMYEELEDRNLIAAEQEMKFQTKQ